MKTTAFTGRMDAASMCAMLVAIGGCAGGPLMDTVAPAELAVNRAIEAKAGEYAPLDLRLAQESLDGARQAMNDEEYEQAHRLVEEARVNARLAEVKAQSEIARKQAREIQATMDTLRQEAAHPGR